MPDPVIAAAQAPSNTYLAAMANRLKPSTVREATRAVLGFDAWLAGRQVTLPLMLEWHDDLAQRKLADSTKNLILTHVKAYVAHLADMGLAETIPTRRLKGFKAEKKSPVVLSREEIKRLVDACRAAEDQYTARAVLCILYTGMRHHEALLLRPHCVRQDDLFILSDKTGERSFPWFLLGSAKAIFSPLPFRWSETTWDKIREAAGLKGLLVKSLRSTFVTYALSSGKLSAYNCAKVAGHTPSVSEQCYQGSPVWGITGETILDWYGLEE